MQVGVAQAVEPMLFEDGFDVVAFEDAFWCGDFHCFSLACVVWLGGLFDLGDFSRLEAECFVESYEHEWCAFVGFFSSG